MIFNEIVCVKHVAKPFAPGKDPIITAIINIVGFGILLIVTWAVNLGVNLDHSLSIVLSSQTVSMSYWFFLVIVPESTLNWFLLS